MVQMETNHTQRERERATGRICREPSNDDHSLADEQEIQLFWIDIIDEGQCSSTRQAWMYAEIQLKQQREHVEAIDLITHEDLFSFEF